MAIVTRYFSTSSAGAGDGTSWADRAALLDGSNNYSAVLTGLDFSGTDSYVCYVATGDYSPAQSLAAALFANPPSMANPLFLHACDASGNVWSPPNPGWCCAQPSFSDTTLARLSSGSNVVVSSMNVIFRGFKLAANRSGAAVSGGLGFDWCILSNAASSASVGVVNVTCAVTNSILRVETTASGAFDYVHQRSSGVPQVDNVQIIGNASATSGDRNGIEVTGNNATISRVLVLNCPGAGLAYTGTGTSQSICLSTSTIDNCGTGILGKNTASQTGIYRIDRVYIANCGTGIDGGSGSRFVVANCRLRDCTTALLANMQNYPTDSGNNISEGDDTEYVNLASSDYRIAGRATGIWGKGYGAGDGPRTIVGI